MAVELALNGLLNISFFYLNGEKISELKETEILNKLQKGEYSINLREKTVVSFEKLNTILFYFDFEVSEIMEYDWFNQEN